MLRELLTNYLKEINQKIVRGDAREETFYPALEKLISSFGQSINKRTEVTSQPKKTEAGNPDFRVWDGQSKIVGYIEAKHPSKEFLEEAESSEQLKRYLEAYPNVLLTNFFEFRLYRNGILWDKPVKISDYTLSQKLPEFPVVQHEQELIRLLTYFLDFTQPRITNPRVLAEILAYKTKIMRDYVVLPYLQEESYFSILYKSFKNHLIKDLKEIKFADYFSQTFTYGLLIAKYQYESEQTLFGKKVSKLPFLTQTAYDYIQKNFGILREVFKVISTQEMPKSLQIIVDDIVDILNHTEIYKLLSEEKKKGKRDPIYHLYETFLLKYDKESKVQLGSFYTPLEIVSYIVNSVHALLKESKLFDSNDGLATYQSSSLSKSVTLLDPAVGTGTFFVEAIKKALEEVRNKYSSSSNYLNDVIRNHILKHFFAFEIAIAPYVVSHLKLLLTLPIDFEFKRDDELKIFLTNTLEFHRKEIQHGDVGLFENVLVTEQHKALDVKNKTPIQIVIGNPPYSVSSQNKVDIQTPFGKFYESYKEKVRKEERNIQPLSDDYIKFLAFAHWKVKLSGKGIVGMITNNSYLDGLIHRDMRQKLLEDFDLIYILNLHGDTKRPQKTTDGKKDENVFDIRQGVSICILVKPEKPARKQVFYSELIGLREKKYHYLDIHDVKTSEWQKLKPKEPYYFFIPKDSENTSRYDQFNKLTDIFIEKSVGVVSGCDGLLIDTTKPNLKRKLELLLDSELKEITLESIEGTQKRKISVDTKRKLSLLKNVDEDKLTSYAYRPFDNRYIYFDKTIVQRLRSPLSENLLHDNLTINVTSQLLTLPFRHAFISRHVSDKCFVSLKSREATYFFPLWVYDKNRIEKQTKKGVSLMMLFDKPDSEYGARQSNINKKLLDHLSKKYKKIILSEKFFYYIYAILYSNIYRKKYEEFLKIGFPKIPFTKQYQLFKRTSKLGKQLTMLHILNSPLLNKSTSRFEGSNGEFVKKWHYDPQQKRIYTNDKQYFTNVKSEVWNYFIGGYQVLDKWLKDRKNKSLSSEEINHYIKVIEAIKQTLLIQEKIDKIYPRIEQSII